MSCFIELLCIVLGVAFIVTATMALWRSRRSKRQVFVYAALAVVVGGWYACRRQQEVSFIAMRDMRAYDGRDLNEQNSYFVIAFAKDRARLMSLRELNEKRGEVSSFYIAPERVAEITRTLRDDEADGLRDLKLLRVDRAARTERVSLQVLSDEYQYFSIYDASDRDVRPIQYGDITKRKLFQSGFMGGWWFAAAALTAVALNIAVLWSSRTA